MNKDGPDPVENFNKCLPFCLRFECEVIGISILVNDEKTRTFVAFDLDKSSQAKLKEIVKKVNLCLKKFKFPTYYNVLMQKYLSTLWFWNIEQISLLRIPLIFSRIHFST